MIKASPAQLRRLVGFVLSALSILLGPRAKWSSHPAPRDGIWGPVDLFRCPPTAQGFEPGPPARNACILPPRQLKLAPQSPQLRKIHKNHSQTSQPHRKCRHSLAFRAVIGCAYPPARRLSCQALRQGSGSSVEDVDIIIIIIIIITVYFAPMHRYITCPTHMRSFTEQ